MFEAALGQTCDGQSLKNAGVAARRSGPAVEILHGYRRHEERRLRQRQRYEDPDPSGNGYPDYRTRWHVKSYAEITNGECLLIAPCEGSVFLHEISAFDPNETSWPRQLSQNSLNRYVILYIEGISHFTSNILRRLQPQIFEQPRYSVQKVLFQDRLMLKIHLAFQA